MIMAMPIKTPILLNTFPFHIFFTAFLSLYPAIHKFYLKNRIYIRAANRPSPRRYAQSVRRHSSPAFPYNFQQRRPDSFIAAEKLIRLFFLPSIAVRFPERERLRPFGNIPADTFPDFAVFDCDVSVKHKKHIAERF